MLEYGNGGEYRYVNDDRINCFGYVLFKDKSIYPSNEINTMYSHNTEDYSNIFVKEISLYTNCRKINSYTDYISANEYRIALRVPNYYLDSTHRYHLIYQLSDGTWAGKDHINPSQHFGRGNPSDHPEMWSNDAYPSACGTVYFAVRR